MKRKEIIRILELFDAKDQKFKDFGQFDNPKKAKEQFEELAEIRDAFLKEEKNFSPFFTDKVMGRVAQLTGQQGFEDYLSMLFYRVTTYGLSAVAIVVLTLYLLHGQEGFNSIISSDSSNDINFISSLFYEY